MTPEELTRLTATLVGLSEVLNSKISPEQLKFWKGWVERHGFSVDEVIDALNEHGDTEEWFPKPSQILRRLRPPIDSRAAALTSWEAVLSSFTCGGNGIPQDEATQFAIRAVGGLRAIGHHPTDKLEWMQRRFVEAFETAADRHAPMLGRDDRPRLEFHGDWRDLA